MKENLTSQAGERTRTHLQKCCFCGGMVNLDEEGTQYANGNAAHEACDDGAQFEKANAADFRD